VRVTEYVFNGRLCTIHGVHVTSWPADRTRRVCISLNAEFRHELKVMRKSQFIGTGVLRDWCFLVLQ